MNYIRKASLSFLIERVQTHGAAHLMLLPDSTTRVQFSHRCWILSAFKQSRAGLIAAGCRKNSTSIVSTFSRNIMPAEVRLKHQAPLYCTFVFALKPPTNTRYGAGADFGSEAASSLDAQAQRIGVEGCRSVVTDAVQTQLYALLSKLRMASSSEFLESLGFTLEVRQSSAPGAGNGLWLEGSAAIGQVVALYPGVSYPPQFHRNIPGYPLVAQSNPFLISRYDGVVIDAKPWGRGFFTLGSPGHTQAQNAAEVALARLETCHPLALAHWANHPPPGKQPNVIVAAFDWMPGRFGELEAQHLRHFVPLVGFNARYAQYSSKPKEEWSSMQCSVTEPTQGVVFVALRDLKDEELFLNYRLNPNAPSGLPSWYCPVDAEEDARRWA
jgi:hypothetical protein